MRLLFLTQTYPRFPEDTAGPFIHDLAAALTRRGHRVRVLAPAGRGVPRRWRRDGVDGVSFRYAPRPLEVLGYGRSLRADERPRPLAAAVAPLYLAAAARAVAAALRREGPFDLLHAHWLVPNAVAARRAAGTVPLAVGIHGSDVFTAEKRAVRPLARAALARTRLVTGCSPELVERVCALGFPSDRARVIPYGVDSERFSPDSGRAAVWRERLGIPVGAIVLLAVGRMATKKGFHLLLEAVPPLLAPHPRLHVVLAGGGDLLAPLRRQAAPWGDRIHFPGPVLRDALPDLYRAADLFSLPAVHDASGNVDGLPNVLLEAMASGLPVVASAVSGIPLAVTGGEHGLLVAEGDVAALREALDRLLAGEQLRRRLGAAGRARALSELTWDAVAGRYEEAYRIMKDPG